MPFKSKAQIRKFYALKRQGKMSQEEIDKWMAETPNPKKLPDRLPKKKQMKVAFWQGFFKAAEGADGGLGDGGSGFTGAGKGNLLGGLEVDHDDGQRHEPEGRDHETQTDKTLLDRERNPRDFSPFQTGPALEDENGTKIVY